MNTDGLNQLNQELRFTWRKVVLYTAIFWAIGLLASGIFVHGLPEIPLTYMLATGVFWICFYLLRRRRAVPSLLEFNLVPLGPVAILIVDVICWLKLGGRF